MSEPQIMSGSQSQRLAQFNTLDAIVTDSLSTDSLSTVTRTESNFDVFAPDAIAESSKPHVVGSRKLSKTGSKHLEKNERLIKALEELRSKMNEKGLRNGKVIRRSKHNGN